MNDRGILDQRVATLDGLIDGTGNLLGLAGATLGERLRAAWATERQLLLRLLAETAGDDVRATIAIWRARTAAFLERAEAEAPAWTDRTGQRWDAAQVLEILDDTIERLDAWTLSDAPIPDEAET